MTTQSTLVSTEVLDNVAVITLQSPPHNLVSSGTMELLADEIEKASRIADVAVLRSEGRSFCAGADFKSPDAPDPRDKSTFEARTRSFYDQAVRLFSSEIPLVAAVHGAAVGAGFGLVLACDIVVASPGASFRANFVRLGIHPGFALSLTIAEAVGTHMAADILLTARQIDAGEASRIGIVQHLVEPNRETDVAVDIAKSIAAGSPSALRATRSTIRGNLATRAAEAMERELGLQLELSGTDEAIEGVNAVLEGRKPRFG